MSMKFVWIFITLMALVGLAPAAVKAQEPIKATTFDGKHVLLYPDGSWKPVITDPGSAAHLGAFAEPQQVTLYSRRKYENYMKATFSFKYGIRDDPGLRITRNLWDLLFDNGDGGFMVSLGPEERSRIVDFGAMKWSDLKAVPIVEAMPEGSKWGGTIPVVQGHLYVVHTLNPTINLYSVFRVEWLERGDQVTISWVTVPSPEAIANDHGPNKALQLTAR
jgi:hypothetical protein